MTKTPHELEIILKDNHQNISTLQATLNNEGPYDSYFPHVTTFEIDENQLHYVSTDAASQIFLETHSFPFNPIYQMKTSIIICGI